MRQGNSAKRFVGCTRLTDGNLGLNGAIDVAKRDLDNQRIERRRHARFARDIRPCW
jgi:hypothetical protein